MRDTIKVYVYDEESGDEVSVIFPAKFEVCDRCSGHGSHTNPNIDGNGITSSEWAEWDEESRETYMSGGYDVSCEECHGARVVKVVDEDALSAEQRKQFEEWHEQESIREREDAEERRYRRMEAYAAGERD